MDAIILFSHGSLLCGSGIALEAHAARLRERGLAPRVEVGYLNYSAPPFLEAVAKCVGAGAQHLLVAPYFLVPGYFVKVDLPKAVTAAQEAFPNTKFTVAEAIGFDEILADALLAAAKSAAPPSNWRDDLKRAAQHCRAAPDCPIYETPYCPNGPGGVGCWVLGVRENPEQGRGARGQGLGESLTTQSPNYPTTQLPNTQREALLVLVHGSPRPIANEDMFRVVERVKGRGVFPIVEVGFLECNAPNIPDAIDACVAKGATRILAVPYFLHTGKHVADDLPTLLEAGRERHPNVEFRLGDYLGRSERLTDILAERIRAAMRV